MHFYGYSPCFGDCEDRSSGLHDIDRQGVSGVVPRFVVTEPLAQIRGSHQIEGQR
jgi:hypothetical protein